MRQRRVTQQKIDYKYAGVVAVLVVFGLIMLASSGAPQGYQRFADSYYFVKRQLFLGAIPGAIACYIMSRIPYQVWKRWSFHMLIASVVLLLLVFIPGLSSDYGTAHSWIVLGGISIQPSELVKLTLLLYMASWLQERGQEKILDFHQGFLPFVMVLGGIMFLILMQPDMGTMLIIVAEILTVYFVAGGHLLHLTLLGGVGSVLLFLMIKLSPYRANRLMTFLHPELDPQGIGYHINQAFLAIGTGGWFGRGYGGSRQKFQYLPEVTADSIFAIIAEELGFFMSVGVIALFIYLFWRGLYIAQRVPDVYGKLIVIGITTWISFQAVVNIGAMVGLFPLTGVPLPFISAGGTSMLVTLAAVGILLNISRTAKAT
jgi:cell division protein FtsW